MTRSFRWLLVIFAGALIPLIAVASDWTHWRGPWQTGVGADKNLPDKITPNVIWTAPYGCRSTPLVLGDNVYILNYDAEKNAAGEDIDETIRERVMCLDAKTGK